MDFIDCTSAYFVINNVQVKTVGHKIGEDPESNSSDNPTACKYCDTSK